MIAAADILNARLLIVDDQEDNVILLQQLLSETGYISIASTMNPHEVCALHRKNQYDLILLDLQMPGICRSSRIRSYLFLRCSAQTVKGSVVDAILT